MNLTAMLRFNVPSTTASGRCSGWWVSDAHAGTALPDVCGTSAGEVHLEVRDGEPRYLVPYSTMCGICAHGKQRARRQPCVCVCVWRAAQLTLAGRGCGQ